ncbi:aminotransferase class III-fold pyridoxal phosphate-dependent enzyme [Haladaptatus cibarius]|uniref:aminotransferase class III-fold pyridoxal phosphate-dependent enzyme n=1 Tax=Haladaptatus cibarius TaxID=453847 RepID=UPI000678FC39|nr:aminotransferase class III-fold pyridoxal phosphate-dependent enzyme [Haladaptatus cibarius]
MSDNLQGSEPIVTDPPAVDTSRVSEIAKRNFGKSGTVSELGGERDQNFRIETDKGDGFVLKIFNRADGREILNFRTQAIQHIQSTDHDLPIMEIVPTNDGDPWTSVDENGETYFVQMYTYVSGQKVSLGDLDDDALYAYGVSIAKMGQALRGFFHPEAQYDILWDLRHASDFRSLLENVSDDQRRDTAERVLDQFEERVEPEFDSLRAQVVHNDLGPDNVLFDDNNRVSGITDFGDLTYTALVCDLAVVLANVMNRHENSISAAESVVRGYVSVTPLEEEEICLLPVLVLTRLVVRGLMHAWKSEKYAHNTDDANELWNSLISLEETGLDVIERLLRTAALESNVPYPQIETSELISRRRQVLGSARLSYHEPVHFVAGDGVWLFDQSGDRYLDAYNNVQVVGHGNETVANAIESQTRKLTTNTRYLHESIVTLSERILDTMPDELDRVLLVNSGSEANDIAWRLATASTGRKGGIVTDHAYHGITDATTTLSPEDWIDGRHPNHVETISPPVDNSRYHGSVSANTSGTMSDGLAALKERGTEIAAFLFDPLFASAGILPPDTERLSQMVDQVHEAGGYVIADEVQAGFGRTGSNMWGFEAADIVPDIVTMGKPMGNGHPVAAVVTRSDITSTLREQPGIFSTFGGNPVSSVAALAVLDVIENEGLLKHASDVGGYLQDGFEQLTAEHDLIGEIRRSGLMVGIELVQNKKTWTPATSEATEVVNRLRQRQVLIGSTGKHENVLKIRPPLVFEKDHADRLLEALDAVLSSIEDTV